MTFAEQIEALRKIRDLMEGAKLKMVAISCEGGAVGAITAPCPECGRLIGYEEPCEHALKHFDA